MARRNPVNSNKRTLLSLFIIFLKIGAFTWGGGYAMLPLIKNEVVEKKKWITSSDFIDGIAVSQSIPGAIALNTATFVGNKISGKLGAIVAVIGAALPSFISIVVVSIFFLRFRELGMVQNFFKGATPAIVALLVGAIIDIGKDALKGYKEIIIAAGLLLLLLCLHMHPVLAIVIAAISGLFVRRQR